MIFLLTGSENCRTLNMYGGKEGDKVHQEKQILKSQGLVRKEIEFRDKSGLDLDTVISQTHLSCILVQATVDRDI